MIELLLSLSIFVVPFPFLGEGSALQGQMILFLILSLTILATRISSVPLRLFVWYFCGWQIFLRVNFVFNPTVYTGVRCSLAAAVFLHMMAAVAVFIVATQAKRSNYIVLLIRLSAVFQLSLAYVQWKLHFYPVLNAIRFYGRPVTQTDWTIGTLVNTGFLAIYLAICLPFFFKGWWRLFILPALILMYHLPSSSASIGLLIGFTYYYYFNRHPKVKFRYLVGLIVSIGLWYVTKHDTSLFHTYEHSRWDMWADTLPSIKANLWFGIGPGGLLHKEWSGIHNDWLRMLVEYGVIGSSLVLWGFSRVFKADSTLVSSLIIAAVCMGGNFSARLASIMILMLVVLGLALRKSTI